MRNLGLWVSTAWRTSPALFLLAAALVLPQVVSPVAQVYGIKLIVDGLGGLGGDPRGVWPGVTVTVVAFAAQFVALAVMVPLEATLNDRAYLRLHRELLHLTASIPSLDHHENPAVADRIALLRNQAREMSYTVGGLIFGAATFVNAFAVLGLLVSVHPVLLVLPLLGLARVWAAAVGGNLRQRAAERSAPERRLAEQLAGLTTSPRAGLEVRLFGLGPFLTSRIDRLSDAVRETQARATWRGAGLEISVRCAFGLAYIAAIGWTIWLARSGSATAGDVALVVLLAPQVDLAASGIAANVRNLGETARFFGRLRWLRDYARARSWAEACRPAPERLRTGITLRDVSFGYPGADRPAVSGVNLELPAGSTVALVGENGSWG